MPARPTGSPTPRTCGPTRCPRSPRSSRATSRRRPRRTARCARYIAHMRLEQHFHPSPAEPAWNIVTENRLFVERGAVEWEELSFALNGATWTVESPVVSAGAAGEGAVAAARAATEPRLHLPARRSGHRDGPAGLSWSDSSLSTRATALYRGTVWIDRELYVRLKVQAVESNLSGMVVSNDETQIYEPGRRAAGPAGLAARSVDQQADVSHRRTDACWSNAKRISPTWC